MSNVVSFKLVDDGFELDARSDVEWPDLPLAFQEYLERAFSHCSAAYRNELCPAIIFELWADSGRMIVYDSPVAERLRDRCERRYTQLSCTAISRRQLEIWDMPDGAEHDSCQEQFEHDLWQITRDVVVNNLSDHLSTLFKPTPRMIAMPWDDYKRVFDLMTGERIDVPESSWMLARKQARKNKP